jgi:hypothetical protein
MKFLVLLLIIFIGQAKADNILRFNIYKSPIGIKWNNPKGLARLTAINTLLAGNKEFGHTLGHLSISVKCDSGVEFHTGMERTDLSESKDLVFNKGAGLGTLVHNFKGNIENEKKVVDSIQHSLENRNGRDLNFIEFLISDRACQRASEYFQAFKDSKTWLNYGMTNNPRMCEGAGCTAYGKSFLEIIGFNDQNLLSEWRGEVNLPYSIIGPHSTKLYTDSHEEAPELKNDLNLVKISKLVNPFSKRITWANPMEKSIKIRYYSPDYMFKWIKRQFRKKQYNARKFKAKSRSKVVTIDLRNLVTPDEPFFTDNCDSVLSVDTEKFNSK